LGLTSEETQHEPQKRIKRQREELAVEVIVKRTDSIGHGSSTWTYNSSDDQAKFLITNKQRGKPHKANCMIAYKLLAQFLILFTPLAKVISLLHMKFSYPTDGHCNSTKHAVAYKLLPLLSWQNFG